jgi:class 3 adenylate cyclase
MRRSRAVDRLLLVTFLTAYLVVLGLTVREYRALGPWWFPFSVTGAQGDLGFPLVHRLNAAESTVRVGDSVFRIGDLDLRGLSRSQTMDAVAPLLRGGQPLRVEGERSGERFDVFVSPASDPYWWVMLAVYATTGLAATYLLLRAPHWHLARLFFVGATLSCIALTADIGVSSPSLGWVHLVSMPLAVALLVRAAYEWTEPLHSPPRWQRVLPWAIALVLGGSFAAWHELTLRSGLWPPRINAAGQSAYLASLLLGVILANRRSGPLERRQLKWVLYGFYVGLLPYATLSFALAVGVSLRFLVWQEVCAGFLVAIPIGIVVSIVGYRWLDIDRLISATASYTILGVAALGSALAFVPRIARAVSEAAGIDPEQGQVALSIALAVVVVPAHRALRPWLDRKLFAERYALSQSFDRLLHELAACRNIEELTNLTGERVDALLRPEAIAIYARTGDAFEPLFVRGRAAPPAFESGSVLVKVLEKRTSPLAARAREISPFDRAALETLGVEVVVPTHGAADLVAFTCLGAKRSGDIYTPTDLALLTALANRCSEVLARLDASASAEQAEKIQTALRRYVPGAVAERLVTGASLAPSEQEVTVLFIDIRDYARFAETRSAEDVFGTLNEHTERVSTIVSAAGGTIVEFNGDGMMAVFGAPEALARKELYAVEAARKIVDSMPAPLAVGVGVATGLAFVGSIRSSDRMIWSAVGNTTNLASRLQSLTRELGASIAVDATTRDRARYVCNDFVRHGDVAIRGRSERLDVWALPLP